MTRENKTIPNHLEALDRFLGDTESRVHRLRVDCEKKIVWFDGKRIRREWAIVYIHGFSASRKETWPLCDRLAKSMGANLFYTRLTGHGQDGPALGEARVSDWLYDGMEAVTMGRMLGKKIILIGTSTGGTLAAWLASCTMVAPALAGLILISPNFFPLNPFAAVSLWPPGLRLFERLFGGWHCFAVSNAIQAHYWTVRYPLRAIREMMRMVCLSWQGNGKEIRAPVLMLLNPLDRVINVPMALFRLATFGSKRRRLVWFTKNQDPGRHVLAGNLMAPEGTDEALSVIQHFLNGSIR